MPAARRLGRLLFSSGTMLDTHTMPAPADSLCIACCTFRAYDACDEIQRALGVPVVTSNQAALTAALRHLRLAPAAV